MRLVQGMDKSCFSNHKIPNVDRGKRHGGKITYYSVSKKKNIYIYI